MNNKRKITYVEHKVFNEQEAQIWGWIGKGLLTLILLPLIIFFPIIFLIEFIGGER
tara:strand:+ start:188 stop:355 length:168 start_codon:yes stop_codon:yes gene_type:complete